jgi:AcrR family transcriptional regulator
MLGRRGDRKWIVPRTKTKTKGSVLPESILQAATRLFVERGFDGTSMHDIADALGVTRTAVYYYYKNKEAILVALTDNITRVAAQLAEQTAQHEHVPPAEALRTLVDRHARLIIDHGAQFRVVEHSEERLPPKLRATARAYRRGVLANFRAVVERGIDAGVFRPADAEVTAFTIIGMCNWTAWWFQPGGRKSREEVAEQIADFAVQAIMRPTSDVAVTSDNLSEALRALRKEIGYLEQRAAASAK